MLGSIPRENPCFKSWKIYWLMFYSSENLKAKLECIECMAVWCFHFGISKASPWIQYVNINPINLEISFTTNAYTVKPLIVPAGTILFLDSWGRVLFKGGYYWRAGTIYIFRVIPQKIPKKALNWLNWGHFWLFWAILEHMRALYEGGYNSLSVGKRCGYNSRAGTI